MKVNLSHLLFMCREHGIDPKEIEIDHGGTYLWIYIPRTPVFTHLEILNMFDEALEKRASVKSISDFTGTDKIKVLL